MDRYGPGTAGIGGIKRMEKILNGPGALLHNKDCPYGYKCRDVDCVECIRIYTDEVDGLASDERDKVNTVRDPG